MYGNYLEEVKKLLGGKDYRIVGRDVRRVDGVEKITGRAKYTADFLMENALVVRPVRSPYPHAMVKKIDKQPALNVSGVECVITGEDIPGENQCGYYVDDQLLWPWWWRRMRRPHGPGLMPWVLSTRNYPRFLNPNRPWTVTSKSMAESHRRGSRYGRVMLIRRFRNVT
jgi:hypothetical protein